MMLKAFLLLSIASATVPSSDEEEAYVRDFFYNYYHYLVLKCIECIDTKSLIFLSINYCTHFP